MTIDFLYGEVRQDNLTALGDGNSVKFPMLRMGMQPVADKWDLFSLSGRMFNLKQTTIGTALSGGTADAGGIVLTVPWVRFTVPSGLTVFPRRLQLALSAAAGTINEIAFVYTDTDTYTSGGTALTPLNWRTDAVAASRVVKAYVGPSGGVITEAAITNPRALVQDALPTALVNTGTDRFSMDKIFDTLIPVIGPASVLLYMTGATTTPAGYFSIDWAEVPTTAVKPV